MPPANYRRKWIKLWIDECLVGSIREDLTPEERSVWYDSLLIAGRNRPPGCISSNETTAISPGRLASVLNIPTALLARATKKFVESGRITIDGAGIIHIVNWEQYQYTDYDRQKTYRQAKKKALTSTSDILDPEFGEIVSLWEDNKGLMSHTVLDELQLLYDENPKGWLIDAIKEAINQGKLSLAYFKAILKRWNSEGRDNKNKPSASQGARIQKYTDD